MTGCHNCCYGWGILDCFPASMEACVALLLVFVVIFAILGIAYGFLAATMAIQRIWQKHYHILAKKELTQDVLDETGKEPGEYHLFLKTHTDKNGVCSSEAVGAMMERYIELCQMQNVDPNDAPIHIWAKAVGVRKNCIIGVPRTKASDIIPIKRSRKRRRYQDDESGASTNGRSLHMADESVIRMVDQTVAYARVHPEEFHLAPEQVLMLEKSVSVAEGDGELPSDHPLSIGTMTELVRVMVSVLTDIQAHQKSDKNEGKGKSVEDGSSFDMDDTRHLPHSPQPDQHSTGGD